jgi:TetR/AcrR family transcriptional regulator, transcriptional repressor for nem operon
MWFRPDLIQSELLLRSANQLRKRNEESLMTEKSTRDHLIDVGLKLMHQHGYNATGLTEILNAADVPKGSFYHHFGSKEDFAAAALERFITHEAEHCATVLGGSKALPLKRLKRYFNDLVKIYGQKGAIPGCMMGRFSLEIAAENPELRKQISNAFAHWQHAIATVVQQAVTEKELPVDTNPESLAGFVLNGWEGALLRSQADRSNAPLEIFMHYVFDGLLAKQSRV